MTLILCTQLNEDFFLYKVASNITEKAEAHIQFVE